MHVYSHSPTSERPGILAPMHLTLLGVQRKQMQAEDIWENGEFVQVLALRRVQQQQDTYVSSHSVTLARPMILVPNQIMTLLGVQRHSSQAEDM
mmetsp:Transcript_27297/g.51569  ORF Transcript_27297/g.51569 Transcript_27297/m.51569 type:complete len:94 (-) Transcript_27297:447-728(-)